MQKKTMYSLGIAGSIASIVSLAAIFIPRSEVMPNAATSTRIERSNNTVSGSEEVNLIQGNNNVVQKTFYSREPERLTSETVDYIVNDYVGDIDRVVDRVIVSQRGIRPFILLIFLGDDRDFYEVHSIKFKGDAWRTSWRTRIPAHPFGVQDGLFVQKRQDVDYVLFKGCFPHMCPDGWGLFMYDPKTDHGFSVAKDYYDGIWRVTFPQGVPEGEEQAAFSEFMLQHLAAHNISLGISLTAAMPSKTMKPIDLTEFFDSKTINSLIPKELLVGQKIQAVYPANVDGDSNAELLVFGSHEGARSIAVVDNSNVYTIKPGTDSIWEDTSSFTEPFVYTGSNGEPPLIVIGTWQGAAGNFAAASLYSLKGGEYHYIHDQQLTESLEKIFGIQGALE